MSTRTPSALLAGGLEALARLRAGVPLDLLAGDMRHEDLDDLEATMRAFERENDRLAEMLSEANKEG